MAFMGNFVNNFVVRVEPVPEPLEGLILIFAFNNRIAAKTSQETATGQSADRNGRPLSLIWPSKFLAN